MRPDVARFVQLMAGVELRSPKGIAIDTVLAACKLAAPKRPDWWQWTVWLAGAITCRRIEAL